MPDCDATRRNQQALHEIQLAIGTGKIDLPRLKRILTSEEQGEHAHD